MTVLQSLKPFSAVVFDMDGTLLDTESVFREIVFEVSDTLGVTMTDSIHRSMVGSSREATNKLLIDAFGESFPYELFDDRCRSSMHARMPHSVRLKTGVLELLDELHGRRIPVAVATSSGSTHALSHLGTAGILERFQTVVTRDDVVNAKPHPEPYLKATRLLGFESRHCLAVEDSHAGVRSAHAAGMQTVMVPDLVHPSDEITALCAAVMDSLHHVREAAFGAAFGDIARG